MKDHDQVRAVVRLVGGWKIQDQDYQGSQLNHYK